MHFKYSDIGAPSYKSLPKLVDAVNAFLTPEEKSLLNGRLVKQDAWHHGSDYLDGGDEWRLAA